MTFKKVERGSPGKQDSWRSQGLSVHLGGAVKEVLRAQGEMQPASRMLGVCGCKYPSTYQGQRFNFCKLKRAQSEPQVHNTMTSQTALFCSSGPKKEVLSKTAGRGVSDVGTEKPETSASALADEDFGISQPNLT